MSLVLGVDSGGTKTLAALADESGKVVWLGRSPSLDPSGEAPWPSILQALLAGIPKLAEVAAAAFGLPFNGEVAAYTAEQERVVGQMMPALRVVDNDVRIAFDGAFAGKSGALILAGTGSMAWSSLNGPGDPHVRVGGWGDVFGDEGSAFWIGREALAAVSRELDGRAPNSGFSGAILRELAIDPSELIAWCYGRENRRSAVAGIAPTVSKLADEDDPTAAAILRSAAAELADTLLAAWRRAAGDRPLRWTYAGGVTASGFLMQRLQERVGRAPVAPRLPPVGGALYRAALKAGWRVTPAWLERLDASLRELSISTASPTLEA
ncbi:N-acetylglucosamine kinase [Jiella sp. M17.18]|uniref:N-acetylglucosamine kinase n=1 Tax=Jiella sp. M17.18 TaxID=3234247 RepID=UPI0034DFC712